MGTFVPSGPAEILRAIQKDKVLHELIEKQITNLLLKTAGTSVWLRYRLFINFSSKFLYYCFTTLSGYQTLGEEYTNIIQVDASLRHVPGFMQRLLMVLLDVGGYSLIEHLLNKFQRKLHNDTLLHEDFRCKLLRLTAIFKAALPFVIHLHLILFYWNGRFYSLAKRITGIRYILTKHWLSKNTRVYGFKILATTSLLHLSLSVLHATYKWYTTPSLTQVARTQVERKYGGKCSLCLDTLTHTSSTMCGHLFCWYCIFEWLQNNDQCPICRDLIEPSRIIPLQNYY